MSGDEGIGKRITLEVQEGIALLAPRLRSWVCDHLIESRQVKLATKSDGSSIKSLWLVIDNLKKN
jgi:hypothetical protein